MSGVATAIVVGSVASGYMASQGAKSAAQTQADAAARAQGRLLETGERAADVYAPYAGKGVTALNMLNYGLGDTSIQRAGARPISNIPAGYSLTPPTPTDGSLGPSYLAVQPREGYQYAYGPTGDRIEVPISTSADTSGQVTVPEDIGFDRGYFTRQFNNQDLNQYLAPGYEFRLGQGQKANLMASNVAGGAVSGNALRSLQDYTQNFASGEYANAFNQFQVQRGNIFSNLREIANMGLTATTGQANAMIGTGTNIASLAAASGNAQAASQIAQGNIYGNTAQGIANAGAYYAMNRPQYYQMPQQSMQPNQTGSNIVNPVAVA